jgi:HK97 gp10 family phage protein
MSVKIENNVKISQVESAINSNIEKALTNSALLVEASAKSKAPVQTGELRSSITHQVDGNEAIVGSNLEYAPYVEKGTGIYGENGRQTPWTYQSADGEWHTTQGQRPKPFLEPAVEESKSAILEQFRIILK